MNHCPNCARTILAAGIALTLLVGSGRSEESKKPEPKKPAATPAKKPDALPERIDPRGPVDDRLMQRIMEAKMKEMLKSGRTLTRWHDQLTARTTRLELPPPVLAPRLSPAEIHHRAEASVVIIGVLYQCDRHSYPHLAMASGFVVSKSGAVVTDLHVLSGYSGNGMAVGVMGRDARVWPVRSILAVDATNDLLVLQAEGDGFAPLPLGEDPPVGAPVAVIGHPADHFYYLTTGVVSRYSIAKPEDGASRQLNITADFGRGSSGAPVLDDRGRLAGVVRSTESISHEASSRRDNHQMVLHNCAPVKAVRELVTTAPKP